MNYRISYPENTKDAQAHQNGNTLIVQCPHCQEKHYHPLLDRYMVYVKSHCKVGFYIIRVV